MEDYKYVDDLVKKAVDRYLRVRNLAVDDLAQQTYDSLQDKIMNWNGKRTKSQLGFYLDYLLGPHMDAIADSGMAVVAVNPEEFIRTMQKRVVVDKVASLLELLQKGCTLQEIREVGLVDYVLNRCSYERGRPQQYIHRFLSTLFMDKMTTIASQGQLIETAKLLGKKTEGVSFESLQFQIRLSVDQALERLEIDQSHWTSFMKATIAFHIIPAEQESVGKS